ncbi:Uncharacterized conserved protein, contains ParB-like and HNH nuclease domains [Flavobacterium fontis]|uniref:Uncharacterized conserved protein, contains ParB-like and HNH nuclease domains n=1 Tax=Flavobacterium fontis TaxID=1124188 RepID=A0A1M5EB76_9FLAO|nr:DUF262 domain-containing protein [Flavobacterium fontis]SHF76513.1 Uncharacterized conserved protein, contains ParB-like and HNH nuclease domains [Flavobacterium fontis]
MNIQKVHLLNLLNTGTNQYIIPFFQRPYVWLKDDCEILYEDVIETAQANKTNPLKEHFIGTIITKNSNNSSQMTAKYDLVDGQQRMTTFSLLIKALANCVDLNQPNANFLYDNINKSLFFNDAYGKVHYRIMHNRIDTVYFDKVMSSDKNTVFTEPVGKSNILDTYRFFLSKFNGLTNDELLNYNNVVLHKFPAISMVLDAHDDEQEIFDTINSLGVKLTTSELLKNFVFNDSQTQDLYKTYWEDIFESDEETIKFWNTKKTAGRLYRENIDVLLYCYLLIQTQKDVSLEHLFKDYKDWLSGKTTADKRNFLEGLKIYAEIYASFPSGTELNNLKFDDTEKRFFHVIENLNITTIFPLVLFIYKEVADEKERAQCLALLESYLVRRNICRLTTKNYNNLFISIIKSVKGNLITTVFEALQNTLLSYTEDTNRFPDDSDVKNAFANSILSNQHAKETLYIIALYQVKTVLNDVTVLSSNSFSVEHMMPKKWEQNWGTLNSQEEINHRNYKLLTFGNLTIITKNLNSKLRNSAWSNKKTVLQQYSSLPLTTQYTALDEWNESTINQRAEDLETIALQIWKK